MSTNTSPFKFLRPFDKDDKDLFFGREEEVERLYDMTFDTRLIVLFGASGTGKTSMVQCGLANKFSETRWQELYIRRGKDIIESIRCELDKALAPFQHPKPIDDPIEGLELLHLYTSKPVFITFDQFEELFILNPDAGEQEELFRFLRKLSDSNLSCKAILVMREEFIAHLWDYEHLTPSIFDHRFRISHLGKDKMVQITEKTLAGLHEQGKISIEKPGEIASAIIDSLAAGKTGLSLTYLQVFLDRLYRTASMENGLLTEIRLDQVKKLGVIDDVLDEFLQEQIDQLEEQLGPDKKGVPLKILGAMVSDDRTKRVLEIEDMESVKSKYGISEREMNLCLERFKTMHIINHYEV